MPKKSVDSVTKKWIRNKADEAAVAQGCRMNLARGKAVVSWIENYCFLYEGRDAGKPMMLMKWQKDCIIRIFGWTRFSNEKNKEVRRFRTAQIFVSKKCGKTPLLAAIALYMLCGDREEGQKCFSVAKDGKQAMLQQQHAIQMVKASAPLLESCEINKSTGQIAYIPTNSFMRVVSGDNVSGQEGLNGSVFIDEQHVVDKDLASVLQYAGRSRDEPLQMGVSTAGNNPDSWGKSQYDYGRQINEDASDIRFFHQEYVAPDGLTDADLDENIEKYLKMANPSIGTTIFMEDLLAEYQKAKRSIAALADYKMYTLGLWQASSSPWLKISSWQSCVNPSLYKPRSLCNHIWRNSPRKKLDAYAALDLSKVSDMCAFGLSIPRKIDCEDRLSFATLDNPGEKAMIQFIIRLWLPEMYAKLNSDKAPFIQWAKDGYLTLTPGDTMDYTIVRRDIKRLCNHFNVLQCAYDPMYAEQTMQDLTHGVYNAETGEIIEDGIGWERVEFAQTIASYAKPTQDFEGIVLSQDFVHSNNPCLNWQAGHVEVASDSFGNKRPIKPKGAKDEQEKYKKIDGIIVAVMASALALRAEKSAYEHGGIFTV